jgi:hypothetical protein
MLMALGSNCTVPATFSAEIKYLSQCQACTNSDKHEDSRYSSSAWAQVCAPGAAVVGRVGRAGHVWHAGELPKSSRVDGRK